MKQSKIEFLAGLGMYLLPDDVLLCEYNQDCITRKRLEKEYCHAEDNINCQTYKFKKRYEKHE